MFKKYHEYSYFCYTLTKLQISEAHFAIYFVKEIVEYRRQVQRTEQRKPLKHYSYVPKKIFLLQIMRKIKTKISGALKKHLLLTSD